MIRSRLIALVFSLSGVTFSAPALSQEREQGTAAPEVKAMLYAYLETNEFSSVGRENLVTAINQYCNYLDYIFPKNSPSDNEWLSQERKGSMERALIAAESVQAAREKAEFFTWQCIVSSKDFKTKKSKEKVSALISLSYAFSKFSHNYPTLNRIETLTRISAEKTGFQLFIGDLTNKLILSANLEHAGCDTNEKYCLPAKDGVSK
jgi:hypothetical protein